MNLLTRRKTSELLGVSVSTVDKWSKKKILNPLRADDATRTVRFSKEEIESLFKSKIKIHNMKEENENKPVEIPPHNAVRITYNYSFKSKVWPISLLVSTDKDEYGLYKVESGQGASDALQNFEGEYLGFGNSNLHNRTILNNYITEELIKHYTE